MKQAFFSVRRSFFINNKKKTTAYENRKNLCVCRVSLTNIITHSHFKIKNSLKVY